MELNDLNLDDEIERNLEDQGDLMNLFDNIDGENPGDEGENFPDEEEPDITGNGDEPDLFG